MHNRISNFANAQQMRQPESMHRGHHHRGFDAARNQAMQGNGQGRQAHGHHHHHQQATNGQGNAGWGNNAGRQPEINHPHMGHGHQHAGWNSQGANRPTFIADTNPGIGGWGRPAIAQDPSWAFGGNQGMNHAGFARQNTAWGNNGFAANTGFGMGGFAANNGFAANSGFGMGGFAANSGFGMGGFAANTGFGMGGFAANNGFGMAQAGGFNRPMMPMMGNGFNPMQAGGFGRPQMPSMSYGFARPQMPMSNFGYGRPQQGGWAGANQNANVYVMQNGGHYGMGQNVNVYIQQNGGGMYGMNRPGHGQGYPAQWGHHNGWGGNHCNWGGHYGQWNANPAGNNGGGSGTGKVYHDPQVLGAQKQRFEFKGANGDAYNLLSTEDMRVNGRMATKGNSTVLDQIGVVDNRGNRIQVDLGGHLTINGREVTGDGQYLNGEVTLTGKNVKVDYDGSTVEIVDRGTWFNTNFTLDNAQYAGGVWGQTVGTANPNAQMITDEATFQRRNIFA
ncbi:hypothetical protein CSC94_14540 [Zhengella mangrovi]|uniref:Uncharacterized protein n=1 Tax=Zhengella mangrovi TaxID=1982044 RepID=A0A2G1QLU2_9HYPH|nr:hypothetical protein [Zhengella mangrovi]PHP66493.1 hypothetical protein CSC94_14540 [Zhengella mangrovi]